MRELLTTNGRIPRSTFWKFIGCFYGIILIFGAADELIGLPEAAKVILGLLLLPLFVVAIIVQIKRWHDLNKSGVWILINFVPCIGGLWSLIECGFIKGTSGENRFGPDPLE